MNREIKFLMTVVGLLLTTPLCLLVFYGNWNGWGFWPVFFMYFNKWPWLKLSVLWTVATTLVAHASISWKGYEAGVAYGVSWLIAVALLWVLYPGPEKFGVIGDSKAGPAIASMTVLHTIGLSVLRSLKLRELGR